MAPEEFGVDLGEFLHLLLEQAKMPHAGTSGLPLIVGFEQELIHFAHRQALGQIIERAMFGAAVMTMAASFAAGGITLHDRGAEQVGGSALNDGLSISGLTVERIDRAWGGHLAGNVIRTGVRRGVKYRLTHPGLARAKELAAGLLAMVP